MAWCENCIHYEACLKFADIRVILCGDEADTKCSMFKPTADKTEWISVEERLPDRNGRYLTHCKIAGQSLVCILYYCKVGGFNEETVTHWMPLPEPPKGD